MGRGTIFKLFVREEDRGRVLQFELGGSAIVPGPSYGLPPLWIIHKLPYAKSDSAEIKSFLKEKSDTCQLLSDVK